MDCSQKIAIGLGIFLALIMLCGGAGFLGYIHGYQSGNEASYSQGKEEGYQAGYRAGYEAGYKPEPEPKRPTGYTLKNPSYQEMKEFLAQDLTNTKKYIQDEYVCVDFAAEVNNNAEALGFRCAIVDIFYPEGYGHTIVAFETTDRGLVFIEPQFDLEVKLVIGKSYSRINNFTPPPRDDTIKRFLIIW